MPQSVLPNGSVVVADEGDIVQASTTRLNFVGAGVSVARAADGSVVITISGGGAGVAVEQDGTPVKPNAVFLNFTGAGVSVSADGAGALVDIPSVTVPAALLLESGSDGLPISGLPIQNPPHGVAYVPILQNGQTVAVRLNTLLQSGPSESIAIKAGDSGGAGPGDLTLTGAGTLAFGVQGGLLALVAGSSTLGTGGILRLNGGSGQGAGGDVQIAGGSAALGGSRGDVHLGSGTGANSGFVRVHGAGLYIDLAAIPTSDPHDAGKIWRNGIDTALRVSTG